jgi:hypothetical protein
MKAHSCFEVGVGSAWCSRNNRVNSSLLLLIALAASTAYAQVGNDNPTGVTGTYGPLVTTACAYVPYTANGTRTVTDLVVNSAIGTYPLAFTRTMNTRSTGSGVGFGRPGGWRHSYSWSVNPVTATSTSLVTLPASYTVKYADGRIVAFKDNGNGDPDFEGPPGVHDRFEPLTSVSDTTCFLRLPDGGKVQFTASNDGGGNPVGGGKYSTTWTFQFTALIDPFGQATNVSYPANGVILVTEPAGSKPQNHQQRHGWKYHASRVADDARSGLTEPNGYVQLYDTNLWWHELQLPDRRYLPGDRARAYTSGALHLSGE